MNLLLVTPTLHVDGYFEETIKAASESLRGAVKYVHLVVGPQALQSEIEQRGLLFLAERSGTRGVFDAVAQGFNWGAKQFQPTWCSYINADDLLLPGFGWMMGRSVLDNESAILYGNVRRISANGRDAGRIPIWPFHTGQQELFAAGIPPFTQQGMAIRTSAWISSGGFKAGLRLTADSELWYRLLCNGNRARFLNIDVACYRIRPGQLSGDQIASERETAMWQPKKRLIHYAHVAFFRGYFMPTYFRRLLAGRILRSKKAIALGRTR